MNQEPYLIRLGSRLRNGLQQMPRERRERHRSFFLWQQQPGGGFAGRAGGSDLYYTSFAVRGLAMLAALDADAATPIAAFLRQFPWDQLNALDLISWLNCALAIQVVAGVDVLADAPADWPEQIAARLERLRTLDGGYARTPDSGSGSTYHSFLVASAYQLIGITLPRSAQLLDFVRNRQRDDGGFVEIAPMKRSGTNPTAAAVAVLKMFDAVDSPSSEAVRRFLAAVAGPEGGFRANTRVPFSDGLSTFTGLLTCLELGLQNLVDSERLKSFIGGCLELPAGGFRAASWDEAADVEYSFYGLGALAVL